MAPVRSLYLRKWSAGRRRCPPVLRPYNGAWSGENHGSVRRGDGLGEGDEVAAGVLNAEFAHAVEGGAEGHDDFHVLHGGEHSVEIFNFHIEIRRTSSGLGGH